MSPRWMQTPGTGRQGVAREQLPQPGRRRVDRPAGPHRLAAGVAAVRRSRSVTTCEPGPQLLERRGLAVVPPEEAPSRRRRRAGGTGCRPGASVRGAELPRRGGRGLAQHPGHDLAAGPPGRDREGGRASAWKLVMPAKRPDAPTPIQVPPATASRGAAWRGAPGGARRAQSSEARPSRSSRLAATTSGQRRSAWKASASVHTPGIYFFPAATARAFFTDASSSCRSSSSWTGSVLPSLSNHSFWSSSSCSHSPRSMRVACSTDSLAARRARSGRGRPRPAPSRGPSPGRWCGRGRGRGST